MIIRSPIFKLPHAFSTRNGGVSASSFASLNLGGSEDNSENVKENRRRLCNEIGITPERVSYLNQIHSTVVLEASDKIAEGDALVCTEKNRAIAVSAADCYPVLFEDSKNGVIGAAHSGWKGTYGEIVLNVIDEMLLKGAEISQIKIAIGPGISVSKYEVGNDLIERFREAGFTEKCFKESNFEFAAMHSGKPKQKRNFPG